MAETLGTKDVLEQVDARLGNVEQDIRALRTEMNSRFDRVYQEISGLRTEMNGRFTWLYGLLAALLLGVAGLWFK
jgi:hypothetical protein